MAAGDRERWNARYRETGAPSDPAPFLVALDEILPRRGRALEAGRHEARLVARRPGAIPA